MPRSRRTAVVRRLVSLCLGAALGALPLVAPERALADEPPRAGGLDSDPEIVALVAQAFRHRPELAQARERLAAQSERVPQAGALPDPSFTVGIQNDSFTEITIGKMETSFVSFMASQTFPWFGKQGLRTDLASLEVRAAQADLARVELSVRSEVERSYLEVLLAREQLGLLDKLDVLWDQAAGLAQTRYEAGEGAQSDLLRAQLERGRLKTRRWALEAEERRRVAVLNRLRGLDEPFPTTRALADLPEPSMPEGPQAFADAAAKSPELERARLSTRLADQRVALARKDKIPDPTVSAGVMVRGGDFGPMWQASVSVPLPVWSGRKQDRAVAENQALRRASGQGLEGLGHVLRQRMTERRALLSAALETSRLYRQGLLVQSEATVSSSLAQYQVGRLTFASVLEALTGYVSDRSSYLDTLAAAQRLAIADRELSLDSAEGPSAGGMGGGAVPGAGASSGGSSSSSSPAGASEGSGGSAMPSKM